MSNHNRQSRRDYYDEDSSDDEYYDDYEQRPRHRSRSLGRRALDKLSGALGGLALDPNSSKSDAGVRHDDDYDDHYRRRRPSSHYREDDDGYGRERGHRRRYHSSSPTRRRSHHISSSSSSHGGRGGSQHGGSSEQSRSRWGRGIEAAVEAAAIEAFRVRKEPGPWKGEKGSRIATAAISAAMIGAATDHSSKKPEKKGTIGSAIGGLVVNRLVNGPRRDLR